MTIERLKGTLAVLVTATAVLAGANGAHAATGPIKEIENSHFGREVDKTTKGAICTVASLDECQPGKASSAPGGFDHPEGAAGASGGEVFVADRGNARVQVLGADGTFLLMFGKEVNKKGTDLCTAGEEAECQAGVQGVAPGQFGEGLQSIAVDPVSGNVYVAEKLPGGARRIQEFAPDGTFVLEIGREVNETKDGEAGRTPQERNLCTEEEVIKAAVKCKAPVSGENPEPGAFNFTQGVKNMLAVGGPEDLLYVGDEHRVQEFDAKTGATDGQYKREIPLTAISEAAGVTATSLAVSPAGDVYLVYSNTPDAIREFTTTGAGVATFTVGAVLALAVNSSGRLAVSENTGAAPRGSLYEDLEVGAGVRALHVSTRFASHDAGALSFNGKDEMYAAFGGGTSLDPAKHEVISWRPVSVAELKVNSGECAPGPEHESDVTLDCTLRGEVDPWGVTKTVVWFDWGRTPALGTQTPKQPIPNEQGEEGKEEIPVKVSTPIEGVIPGETFYYELRAEDDNDQAPEEPLTSPTQEEFATPSVPPRIVGEPIAAFQTPTSSVFFGLVNPENTPTSYAFQYVPEAKCDTGMLGEGKSLAEACAGILETGASESSQYGPVGAAIEGSGLQPATRYRYRLYAENEKGQGAVNETGGAQLPEGTFETAPAPAVTAVTGEPSAVTTTSAVISGFVNPDGQASTYRFELGVYNGAATRYGVVFSGPAGAGAEPVPETFPVTGLQPGTAYAYRISIHFGTGTTSGSSATGETKGFKTLGLPVVLTPPAPVVMVQVPQGIAFPKEPPKLTAAQKLANALRACKKKPRKKRARCERSARAKYAATKGKGKKKK